MLSKERLITYCIIFILLGTLIYFIFLGNEEYVVNYDVKIEALESKVDSLHNINDNLGRSSIELLDFNKINDNKGGSFKEIPLENINENKIENNNNMEELTNNKKRNNNSEREVINVNINDEQTLTKKIDL